MEKTARKRRGRNIHIDVDPEFHRRLKMVIASQETQVQTYCHEAIERRLVSDERAAAKK